MSRPDQAAASPSRDEYPKDCPNCGLWLTAESMDCPRCMTKLPHESGAEQKREQAEEAVEEWRGAGGKVPDQPMRADSAARDRRFVRDVVRGELRKGNIRLALAILLWPPGWSHTRLEDV